MSWINPLPLRLAVTTDSESFRNMDASTTGLPVGDHPGAFGYVRKNHVHEGVDLYCPDGTRVYAVESGEVVAIIWFTGEKAEPASPWWRDTQAVLVEGPSGVVVYGEIVADDDLQPGCRVEAGEPIGRVTPVLKVDKGRPMTMLHLELHTAGTRDAYEWPVAGPTPPSLLDPTPYLRAIADGPAFMDVLERRDRLHRRAIAALAHVDRERAMNILLSWIPLDDLENRVLPTIASKPTRTSA